MRPWTPSYEMGAWTKALENKDYFPRIEEKHDILKPEVWVKDLFGDRQPNLVVSIGGGLYGGELCLYKGGKRRILIDLLVPFFVRNNGLPSDIEGVTADFGCLPLDDNSVDVLFCCNTLDHATSVEHLRDAQREICRVLAPKGVFFFHHPFREGPQDGHMIVLSQPDLMKGFVSLSVLKDWMHGKWEYYCIMTKA